MKEKNAIWMIALLIFSIGVGIAVQGPQTLNPFYPLDVPLNLSGQYIYDSTGDVTINDTVDLNDSHLMDVEDELSEASGSAALPLNYSNRTYLKLNGTNAMEGILDLNGTNLTNVGGLNDCGDEEALIGNGSCRPIMNKLHEFLERDNSVGNHNISMNGQDIRNVELLDQCRLCLEQIRVDFPVSEFPPEDPEYRKKTCTDSGSTQEGWATLTSDSGSGSHDAFWRFKFQCGPRDTEEEEIDTSGCETDYSVLIAGKENDYIDWEDERPVYDLTDSTFTAVVYNGETAADITVETDTGYSETIFMEASGRDGVAKEQFVIDPYSDAAPNTVTATVEECSAVSYTHGDDSGEIIYCNGYFDDDGDGSYGSDLETKDCSLADVQGSPGNDCNDEDPDVQDNCDSGGNSAPTASFAWEPVDPAPGDTIDFTSGSSDSDGSIESYEWDWDDDNTYEATGSTASTSYSSDGDYPVTHRVTDNDGATDTATQTVTVGSSSGNSAPTSSFSFNPFYPDAGETVNFDGTDSSDSDGTIESYKWDWTNDGATDATGSTASHSYSTAGDYDAALTVTDDDGATSTMTQLVIVDNLAPTASFTYNPTNPNVDETVTFDASGSSDDDGTIESYEWDWGDETATSGSGETDTHSYGIAGDYDVTLTVTDDDGNTDTATQTITVGSSSNSAPTADFSWDPPEPDVDESISFAAGTSFDSDGSITSYEWDWDDDGDYEGSGSTPSHSYSSSGDYPVTLQVTDDDGATDTTTQTITVGSSSNSAPTADFTYSPDNAEPFEPFTFDASDSSDSDGTIESYKWDWTNDGATDATGSLTTHGYDTTGYYDVTLTVTDNDGATDWQTYTVTVCYDNDDDGACDSF